MKLETGNFRNAGSWKTSHLKLWFTLTSKPCPFVFDNQYHKFCVINCMSLLPLSVLSIRRHQQLASTESKSWHHQPTPTDKIASSPSLCNHLWLLYVSKAFYAQSPSKSSLHPQEKDEGISHPFVCSSRDKLIETVTRRTKSHSVGESFQHQSC